MLGGRGAGERFACWLAFAVGLYCLDANEQLVAAHFVVCLLVDCSQQVGDTLVKPLSTVHISHSHRTFVNCPTPWPTPCRTPVPTQVTHHAPHLLTALSRVASQSGSGHVVCELCGQSDLSPEDYYTHLPLYHIYDPNFGAACQVLGEAPLTVG